MTNELKNTLENAVKNHSIVMKEEEFIVRNLEFSESWFLSTFEKLK